MVHTKLTGYSIIKKSSVIDLLFIVNVRYLWQLILQFIRFQKDMCSIMNYYSMPILEVHQLDYI